MGSKDVFPCIAKRGTCHGGIEGHSIVQRFVTLFLSPSPSSASPVSNIGTLHLAFCINFRSYRDIAFSSGFCPLHIVCRSGSFTVQPFLIRGTQRNAEPQLPALVANISGHTHIELEIARKDTFYFSPLIVWNFKLNFWFSEVCCVFISIKFIVTYYPRLAVRDYSILLPLSDRAS